MTTKEFLINLALLALILVFGWLTFNLEQPEHEPTDIDALIARAERDADETPAPVDPAETSFAGAGPVLPAASTGAKARYPKFDAHDVFETLIVTPSPTPTPIPVPPPIPPLKEALRGRWSFSYAMTAMGEGMWTDNSSQQQVKIPLGGTTQFQYGKFNYTVRLDKIDDDQLAAHLSTIFVSVDDFRINEDELNNPDQKVIYSAFTPALNP